MEQKSKVYDVYLKVTVQTQKIIRGDQATYSRVEIDGSLPSTREVVNLIGGALSHAVEALQDTGVGWGVSDIAVSAKHIKPRSSIGMGLITEIKPKENK